MSIKISDDRQMTAMTGLSWTKIEGILPVFMQTY